MSFGEFTTNFHSLPEEVARKLDLWFQWDKNEKTIKELKQLVAQNNVDELSARLLKRQVFGTAGIRGLMEAGFNGLNDLIIIQTSQGLAKYLVETNNRKATENGVIIGYDGRHNSYRFACLTSNAFLRCGFRVYLFSKIVPTPFVAYAVRKYNAAVGVVVTASHNPKQYNGFKVYADNGVQVISPADEHIQQQILNNLQPWDDEIWNTDNLIYGDKLIDPLANITASYMADLRANATQLDVVSQSDLRVVYTPLHGVGHESLTRAFQTIGLKHYFPVLSQKDPDPEFSTVVFPNPEEGKGVLNESFKTAAENKATLIIANDPDSDRCSLAEFNHGEWRVFNGNEIGALFGWWIWHEWKNNFNGEARQCYMISSAVSSKILETFAEKEGFNFVETLTGFKWMANCADDLLKKEKTVLFAFEEAIGYMIGTTVLDKDGISAASAAVQMAAYLRRQNLTLLDQLNSLYLTYGYHYSLNSYFICHDQDKINRIFNRVADLEGPGKYVSVVNGVKVLRVRDLNRGFDSKSSDNKPDLPVSSSSFMLTLYFENGSVITFRTSGTEPKIKYYSEIIAKPTEKDWNKVEIEHKSVVDAAVQLILNPIENQLQAKAD